jgi:hypothetical protein
MCDLNPAARARKISPLHISASQLLLAKITLILALKHCSSGSIAKSILAADFWSPYNEEPLDENRDFGANELFLFAHPSGRVRCAAGAFATSSPAFVGADIIPVL